MTATTVSDRATRDAPALLAGRRLGGGLARSGRRWIAASLVAIVLAPSLPSAAWAADARPEDAGATSAVASGVAVVAGTGAEDAAWALARELYARASLRPASLDEARARVLVGKPAPVGAGQPVADLADERAGIRGDDGASRALLRAIAGQLAVRALVFVEVGPSGPSARVFDAESAAFDAARYAADPLAIAPASAGPPDPADAGTPDAQAATSDGGMSTPTIAPAPVRWSGTVVSLERAYGAPSAPASAPALATSPVPPAPPAAPESHPFYTSPWFWGAVGAAAFGGVAVYFATRDTQTDTIHLELQVPK